MPPEDDRSSLERVRERLYSPEPLPTEVVPLAPSPARSFPHAWKETLLPRTLTGGKRHVRIATLFFGAALVFFLISALIAGYFFYFGGNSVSVDKVDITLQGPTTVAGGDTVPLSLLITNRNPVALENATIEITFPPGTRDAADVLAPYPRYSENLGTIPSGATVTRSIRAVVFGAAGQTLVIPISFSYSATGSNAVFVKKPSYALALTSTPLSVSVDTVAETVSGKPLTLTLTVRSNATVPIDNVVLAGAFPFGFTAISSSVPLTNSGFFIGALAPEESKTITLTGALEGQQSEERVFHFTVGTARGESDPALTVPYMTQDASVRITAPFIATTLAINGDTSSNVTLAPGSTQSATVSYTNTLSTPVTSASVAVRISGSAVDYDSIETSNGFYNSSDHTILFSRDTDSSFAALAPGASGIGSFTFATLPPGSLGSTPTLTFTISVAGTRVGESNVPEEVTATMVKTAKIVTNVVLATVSTHVSGPVPPRAEEASTYRVEWSLRNGGSAIADGVVSALLPSYVTYADATGGAGSFSYDSGSRTVTWKIGNLAQGAAANGSFEVSLTPSSSQQGSSPALTSEATFSGYDRFAGVTISASAPAATTRTGDDEGIVQ